VASTTFEVTVTGIPLWLLQEYLEELGARPGADGELQGEGWRAQLTQLEDYRVGSLHVGRVRLELAGSPEAISQIKPALEKKLLRAGG